MTGFFSRWGFWHWVLAVNVALLGLLGLAGWWLFRSWEVVFVYILLFTGIDVQDIWDPPVRWHVKQAMAVETPVGDVNASVVRSKVLGRSRLIQSATGSERGEALVVPLPDGRYLFALIDEFRPGEERVFFPGEWMLDGARKLHTVKGQVKEVPRERYPLMVTFWDLTNPATVQEVDPDNLAATFGEGYRIKSYTVEITDEPVTEGSVEKALPWIDTLVGSIGKDKQLPYKHLMNRVTDGSLRLGVGR